MNIDIVEKWDEYLLMFNSYQQDIYFRNEYVELYENDLDRAFCVVVHDNCFCLLMPFLRREIVPNFYDFETPYGYGGFISNSNDTVKIEQALFQIKQYFKANNYIAGFVRFHPLLNNADQCIDQVNIKNDRSTIAIDLRPSEEDIWLNQVHTKNRNTIKKSQKRGLEFIADHDFEYINDFICLYNKTMNRLGADNFYYFADNYYNRWLKNIKQSSFIAVVKFDQKVISACIVMYQKPWGHYHLSGSDRDFLYLDPNNFMLWNAAMELKKIGIEYFHLGGGINDDPQNSLFKFKERFSHNKYLFSFGKMIFNIDLYNQLCNDWEINNPNKTEIYKHHLLKYRY